MIVFVFISFLSLSPRQMDSLLCPLPDATQFVCSFCSFPCLVCVCFSFCFCISLTFSLSLAIFLCIECESVASAFSIICLDIICFFTLCLFSLFNFGLFLLYTGEYKSTSEALPRLLLYCFTDWQLKCDENLIPRPLSLSLSFSLHL